MPEGPPLEDDFAVFEAVEGDPACGLLLLCDHARNALPAEYGSLGLPPEQFRRHIAYDIGARDFTLELARLTGAPAVLSTFSRLLIDPNRGADDPTLVMRISDGAIIPGNHPIAPREIDARLRRFHTPYHEVIKSAIETALESGNPPAVFSVHSFTERWKGVPRPWQATLLWDGDPRFTKALMALLRAEGDIVTDENEPYDGALRNDTMFTHCVRRGLAHTLIELRQDLIDTPAKASQWAARIAPMLAKCNADPHLHEIRHFPSRTGPYMPFDPKLEA